jgi:hypothetical protein
MLVCWFSGEVVNVHGRKRVPLILDGAEEQDFEGVEGAEREPPQGWNDDQSVQTMLGGILCLLGDFYMT